MKIYQITILIFIILSIASCSSKKGVTHSNESQLQLRQIQTKIINSTDKTVIMQALMQLLQDDGYVVKSVESDIGFFQAVKKLDGDYKGYEFALYDIIYPIAIAKVIAAYGPWGDKYIKELEATVSMRKYKTKIAVRVSFRVELKDDGKVISSSTVTDSKYYKEFYTKFDKALFLENNDL